MLCLALLCSAAPMQLLSQQLHSQQSNSELQFVRRAPCSQGQPSPCHSDVLSGSWSRLWVQRRVMHTHEPALKPAVKIGKDLHDSQS